MHRLCFACLLDKVGKGQWFNMEPSGCFRAKRTTDHGFKNEPVIQAQPMTSLMTAALSLLQTIVNIIRLSFDIGTV